MMPFLLALLILMVGSLPWLACFRLQNKHAWLMALYLIGNANIVLTLCIANSFYALNQFLLILAIHSCFGGIGWLVWYRTGKPALRGPFTGWKPTLSPKWIKSEPTLAILALSITLSYIFAFVQIVYIPQNNMDSLSTHLSRIVFWRQNGSFFPWPTYMLNQVWYPINAQLQTYWTLLFLNSDRLVGSIQWLAAIVSAVGVFGLAQLFRYSPRQSVFAMLVFLSFPLIALQSTTTQTDLVTMGFFIPAVYFLILGIREGNFLALSLSAISIGLGIGTKKSYFLLIPILAIIGLTALLAAGRQKTKYFIYWVVSSVIGISLLGAYIYVVNWHYFGDPFGSPSYFDSLIETPDVQSETIIREMPVQVRLNTTYGGATLEQNNSPQLGGIFMELTYNVPRLIYQSLDTSGLPRPLDGYAHKVKMRIARAFFHLIGFNEIEGNAYTAPGHTFSFSDKNINEESHAWYGPLSFLLILPALFIEARRGIKQRFYLLLTPGLALLLFLPMEIILRPGWDPYQGRYFAPIVALCSPLMAVCFKEKENAIHEWLISLLAIVILAVTLLYNPSKPTLGKYADEFHVWNNDQIFVQTIQRKKDRDLYYKVEKFVPENSVLGYYIPFYILDYPLFGEHLERRLVPITDPTQLADAKWLRTQGLEYLLISTKFEYPTPPSAYEVDAEWGSWILYVRKTAQ